MSWKRLAARELWVSILVLVLVVVAVDRLFLRSPDEGARKGEPGVRLPAASEQNLPPKLARLSTEPPVMNPDGSLQLRWQPFEGADQYLVRVFSLQRLEVGRFEATGTSLTLGQQDLANLHLPGKALLWRVVAQRAGQDLAASAIGTQRLP